jgi:hypothetical protein
MHKLLVTIVSFSSICLVIKMLSSLAIGSRMKNIEKESPRVVFEKQKQKCQRMTKHK